MRAYDLRAGRRKSVKAVQPTSIVPARNVHDSAIAIVDGDRDAAEMLHTFLPFDGAGYLLEPDEPRRRSHIRRLRPDIIALDL